MTHFIYVRTQANKIITHSFRNFEARSVLQRLKARVHDPAVRMPAVPLLLCENPTESGVVCVTCHPGMSFGSDGSREVVFGSAQFVDEIRALTMRARHLDAELAIGKVDKEEEENLRVLREERDAAHAKIGIGTQILEIHVYLHIARDCLNT